ncbi:unnamed protein product [Oikopleura dioica]|uniref:Uncharacterized protein n=1 Tax=Oikopleura dioica TaxID=34765 RepID=E4X879_OIKDI|nr:unnamed protein product [Oikopleura dioica]
MSSHLHLQVSLRRASAAGDLSEVVRLVESESAEINGRGKTGWSALHKAAEHGQAKVIRYLCRKGADVNCTGGLFDGTPLHHAVYWGQVRAVQQLLKAGADPNIQNANGDTSLAIATDKNLETVVMLIKNNTIATLPSKKEDIPEFFPQKIKEEQILTENKNADTQIEENSKSTIVENGKKSSIPEKDPVSEENLIEKETQLEEKFERKRPSMQIVRKSSNEIDDLKVESIVKPIPIPRSSCPTILPSQLDIREKTEAKQRSVSILEQSPFIKSKIEGIKLTNTKYSEFESRLEESRAGQKKRIPRNGT